MSPASIADQGGFEAFGLDPALVRAVRGEGYDHPTAIQTQAIPHVIAGRDLLGCAQTGSGKTAAFALPILQRIGARGTSNTGRGHVAVLVLAPTRELAAQIGESFATYGRYTGLRQAVIYGGVGQQKQVDALRRGADIVVATPGRLCDLIHQGHVPLSQLQVFVLDEADRMLDMGFLPDLRRIVAAIPRKRQTLLFSATMPGPIEELARAMLSNPVRVDVVPVASTAVKIDQSVYFVAHAEKRALMEHLLKDRAISRAIVFTRTKHGANRVSDQLMRASIGAAAIHGNKSQSARERALEQFKGGAIRVLVATDIAARGIDVEGISHVINYDLPNEPETYVHRIGRTARAGASGTALSFCSPEERSNLLDIERLIRKRVPVVEDHPFRSSSGTPRAGAEPAPSQQRFNGRGGGGGGGQRGEPRGPSRATSGAARPPAAATAPRRRRSWS